MKNQHSVSAFRLSINNIRTQTKFNDKILITLKASYVYNTKINYDKWFQWNSTIPPLSSITMISAGLSLLSSF